MRLRVSKSKNAASLYVIKTIYEGKKERTITVEKLGTEKELREKLNGQDPYEWARQYIAELNEKEKEEQEPAIMTSFSPKRQLPRNRQTLFHGGYLFLQQIYHELGFPELCKKISKNYKFEYDLNQILSRLLYSRILFPASKRSTFELSKQYIESPQFDLHHIYRALEVLAENSSFLQAELYKNSAKIMKRNTGVLYYDCTNFFFEIEEAEDMKQYGISKEHRPNPIIQMGLFMDKDGFPLAFHLSPGNTNEQTTLKPLEEKILSDFSLSQFVVCTDAGLSSMANRKFNTLQNRAFVTTQSLKKMKSHLRAWAIDPTGWHLEGNQKTFDLSTLDEEKYQNAIFYKERWFVEDGLEQHLIVTYSIKYKKYQRQIREKQLERAYRLLESNPKQLDKKSTTDYKRLLKKLPVTADGEIAEDAVYTLHQELLEKEQALDGFYAVCTNLEDHAATIAKINKQRWEIEECFRIMKSEFKARPVYVSKENRIQAHFLTCFLSLFLFRMVEKKLGEKYTCDEILTGLRDMNFYELPNQGYLPAYQRTAFTDDLHDAFGFRTDFEIIPSNTMKKILKHTKK